MILSQYTQELLYGFNLRHPFNQKNTVRSQLFEAGEAHLPHELRIVRNLLKSTYRGSPILIPKSIDPVAESARQAHGVRCKNYPFRGIGRQAGEKIRLQ